MEARSLNQGTKSATSSSNSLGTNAFFFSSGFWCLPAILGLPWLVDAF